MSRRAFRAQVETPRPASAWALVTVAAMTLWITQQLDVWAVVVQAGAILLSLWRRTCPFAWQKGPVALNLGMFGITGATILIALRGDPSTIALAHFAALAQGLQLLDARPRQTEFLLVALALFQVVLAANLTDSVFFPPLVLAFVFAAVWTLMVHTLRLEAIEAGDQGGVSRAITPGLMRATLVATALSVTLALALFVVLPRLRTSVVSGSQTLATLAAAGFSDHVALGELGRIRQDPTVVMRIETLEREPGTPVPAYWRGLAFDHFDGVAWSITPNRRTLVPGSPEAGITLGRSPDQVNLVQRIVREPVERGVVFGAGEVRRLQGTVRRLERDRSGGLYAVGQADERVRYVASSFRRRARDTALEGDAVAPPPRGETRYLQLPALTPAVAELALEVVRGHETDAARLRALEQYLVRNGSYTDLPPQIDPDAERSPVEAFLFGGMAGHCEYFASSMVVLARSLGMPTRLVNGFAGGRPNEIGDFLEIARSDAHTWVEVHYADAGWVRYDPTPADLRARPAAAASFSEQMRQLASALELWWFQRVVGFDRSDQIRALKQAWLAWRATREPRSASSRRDEPAGAAPDPRALLGRALPWAGAVVACIAAVLLWRRRGRRTAQVPAAYANALRLLARRGLVREPTSTARAFAERARTRLSGDAAAAFDRLTEAYLAQRFGGLRHAPAAAALEALRSALARR